MTAPRDKVMRLGNSMDTAISALADAADAARAIGMDKLAGDFFNLANQLANGLALLARDMNRHDDKDASAS